VPLQAALRLLAAAHIALTPQLALEVRCDPAQYPALGPAEHAKPQLVQSPDHVSFRLHAYESVVDFSISGFSVCLLLFP